MKFSIALSVLILAVGLTCGFLQRRQVSVLREDRSELAATAGNLGIAVAESNAGEPRVTKRLREERSNQSDSVSAALLAFAKEREKAETDGDSGKALEKQGLALAERLMAMDQEQLKSAIMELRAASGISDETRREMISFSIRMLSENYPEAALGVLAEHADTLKQSYVDQHVFSVALGKWAKENPRAALSWLQENAVKHPELAEEDSQLGVLAGAAEKNPKLAFQLLTELRLTDSTGAVQSIVESAKSPEQRSAILTAFRDHLAGIQDESERAALREEALGGLARSISEEDYNSVTSWVASQKLTAAETEEFVSGLSFETTKSDTGKWIEWMAKSLPSDSLSEPVADLVSQWTQQDYLAAGKWLAAEPDGPAKSASVRAYAETVAEYEPQTAAQWALTLPPGEERTETLKTIYQNWPKNDATAAAAFAAEHGITPDSATEEP